MFAKTLSLLLLVGVTFARDLTGVDPNTLQCDPLGHEHLLLPHFTDCNKYFTCSHGKELERTCPGALIFDFDLQTCNWAWATECNLRTQPEEDEVIEGSGDSSEVSREASDEVSGEGSGEGSGEIDWADDIPDNRFDIKPIAKLLLAMKEARAQNNDFSGVLDCSSPISAARQVAFKGDCQRYWRCVNNLAHSFYCSDGLFFNEKTMQCDFESNVQCVVDHDKELDGEFLLYK